MLNTPAPCEGVCTQAQGRRERLKTGLCSWEAGPLGKASRQLAFPFWVSLVFKEHSRGRRGRIFGAHKPKRLE